MAQETEIYIILVIKISLNSTFWINIAGLL